MNSIYKPGRMKEYDPFSGGAKPPAAPGEYRILSKRPNSGRNVEYVGTSTNVRLRVDEHVRSGKIKNGSIVAVHTADPSAGSAARYQHEREKIRKHNPPLNKSRGGEGPR